jgi:SPP1 gp7 family putative phage head morphogenesis protein
MSPQLRKALAMERDRAKLEAIGRIRAEAIALRARLSAMRVYRQTNSPMAVVMELARVLVGDYGPDTLVGVVADGMVAGHLEGIVRTQKNLSERSAGRKGLRLSSAYGNALDFLRKRTGITQEQADKLRTTYGPAAAGAVQSAATAAIGKVGEALTASLQAGDGVRQGITKLRQAFTDSGMVPGANYQLEQVFRTQTQLAYSAGRMNSLADPAVQEILWGYEYVTVGDDRVRPTHMAMDGVKAPKDDPIWDKWTPPNGYNCRCAILEVFDKGEAKAPDVPVEPDKGFAFNPGDITIDVVPPAPPAPAVSRSPGSPAPEAPGSKSDPAVYKREYQKWTNTLTTEQAQAIELWESDIPTMQDMRQFSAGRSSLNFTSGSDLEQVKKQYVAFEQAMSAAPRFEGTVYRGLANPPDDLILAMSEEGSELQFDAFSSSSRTKDAAEFFAANAFDPEEATHVQAQTSVVLKIKTKSGADLAGGKGKLAGPSTIPEQQEIILRPGARYRVVSAREDFRTISGIKKDVIDVELEEI